MLPASASPGPGELRTMQGLRPIVPSAMPQQGNISPSSIKCYLHVLSDSPAPKLRSSGKAEECVGKPSGGARRTSKVRKLFSGIFQPRVCTGTCVFLTPKPAGWEHSRSRSTWPCSLESQTRCCVVALMCGEAMGVDTGSWLT